MTTTKNNEHKKLNFSSEREQSQACLNSAEHEKNQGRKVLNVPNLRFKEFQGEWKRTIFKNVITLQRGSSPRPIIEYVTTSDDGVNWIKIGDMPHFGRIVTSTEEKITKEGAKKSRQVNKGDLILSNSMSYGLPYIMGIDGYIHDGWFVLKNFENTFDKDYLCNLLISSAIQNQYKRLAAGGVVQNISSDLVNSVSVSIPTMMEQKKISSLLNLIDERIATQNKIIDKLQSLIKGINQNVFTDDGFNYMLKELCEIRSGYSGNQLTSKNGLKVSRIETISGHKVNIERVGYVAPFASSENYKLQIGDILFSNINSVEYIGNTAFIEKDYGLYHGMNLLRLMPNKNIVIPLYLYLLLNTNKKQNHFKTICNKAVSQASINQTELGKTVVKIPSIKAQKQICELYQSLYNKLETENNAISLLQKQKEYLLRQMFI